MICIFLQEISGVKVQSTNQELFPLYNYRYSCNSKTETLCTTINNVPLCNLNQNILSQDILSQGCNDIEETLNHRIINMRLNANISAVKLSELSKVNTSTISRYENAKFKIDLIDLDVLQNLAISCDKDKLFLFDEFLLFRLYHINILEEFIKLNNLTKLDLSRQVDLSIQLVRTWFKNKKRCPSYQLWQTTFREFTLIWIKNNID